MDPECELAAKLRILVRCVSGSGEQRLQAAVFTMTKAMDEAEASCHLQPATLLLWFLASKSPSPANQAPALLSVALPVATTAPSLQIQTPLEVLPRTLVRGLHCEHSIRAHELFACCIAFFANRFQRV